MESNIPAKYRLFWMYGGIFRIPRVLSVARLPLRSRWGEDRADVGGGVGVNKKGSGIYCVHVEGCVCRSGDYLCKFIDNV